MKNLTVIGTIGKVIGFIFLALILLMIIAIIYFVFISKSNDAYKGDYMSVLKKDDSSAPKALLVYQPSRGKASSKIANELAKGLNDAGYEVTITYPGKHLSSDITQYSVVAFGSPVYIGKPSAALTGSMKQISDYSDKTVIIYSVGQSPEAPELDVVKECLNGKEPDYTKKFIAKDESKGQIAYDLGLKAGKESRGKQ